jgi:hypothetical protein
VQSQHRKNASLGDTWQTDGKAGIVDYVDIAEHPNSHTDSFPTPIVLQISGRSTVSDRERADAPT